MIIHGIHKIIASEINSHKVTNPNQIQPLLPHYQTRYGPIIKQSGIQMNMVAFSSPNPIQSFFYILLTGSTYLLRYYAKDNDVRVSH